MADYYSSMTSLYGLEPSSSWNRTIRLVPGSKVLISAPHGGGIELRTTDLADKIAGSRYNFHTFRGLLSSENNKLHVTSTHYDCPYLEPVNQAGDYTLTVHGAAGTSEVTYVGGLDIPGMNLVKSKLLAAGFTTEPPLDGLYGTESLNITNRNSNGKGIQLELTRGLRDSMTTDGVLNSTFWNYVNAVRAALFEHTAEGTSIGDDLMANFTPNYNLRKPVGTEQFDIDRDFNVNWDAIDEELGNLEVGVASKADKSNTYTKTENDTALALKADKSNTYTKTEVDNKDALKADKSTTYTKTEVDTKDTLKADKVNVPSETDLVTVAGYNQYYPVSQNFTKEIIGRNVKKVWDGTAWVTSYSHGFGFSALENNTGTSSNGFGNTSLQNNTGSYSSGFGNSALRYNTGSYSSGFGHNALRYNTSQNNSAFGAAFSGFYENTAGAKTFDSTAVNSDTKNVTITAHGFGTAGTKTNVLYKSTTGTEIGGLTVGTVYQITIVDADNITVTNITSAGTGTHTFTPQLVYSNATCIGANSNPVKSNAVVLGDTNVDTIKMGGTNRTPTSATATGTKGETCWDANYFYICVATNTWKRTALTTW